MEGISTAIESPVLLRNMIYITQFGQKILLNSTNGHLASCIEIIVASLRNSTYNSCPFESNSFQISTCRH